MLYNSRLRSGDMTSTKSNFLLYAKFHVFGIHWAGTVSCIVKYICRKLNELQYNIIAKFKV